MPSSLAPPLRKLMGVKALTSSVTAYLASSP